MRFLNEKKIVVHASDTESHCIAARKWLCLTIYLIFIIIEKVQFL